MASNKIRRLTWAALCCDTIILVCLSSFGIGLNLRGLDVPNIIDRYTLMIGTILTFMACLVFVRLNNTIMNGICKDNKIHCHLCIMGKLIQFVFYTMYTILCMFYIRKIGWEPAYFFGVLLLFVLIQLGFLAQFDGEVIVGTEVVISNLAWRRALLAMYLTNTPQIPVPFVRTPESEQTLVDDMPPSYEEAIVTNLQPEEHDSFQSEDPPPYDPSFSLV